MDDVLQDYETFRNIVSDYANRVMESDSESSLQRNWIVRCFKSFEEFQLEFADKTSRLEMLNGLEQTVRVMSAAYQRLLVASADMCVDLKPSANPSSIPR